MMNIFTLLNMNNDFAAVMPFLAIIIFFYGSFIIIGLALYVLESIGIFKMAKTDGQEGAWLAFFPILRLFIYGKLVGEFKIGKLELKNLGLWLLFLVVGMILTYFIIYGVFMFSIISNPTGMMTPYNAPQFIGAPYIIASGIVGVVFLMAQSFYAFILAVTTQRIFKKATTVKNANVLTVLSMMFLPVRNIAFFALRNKYNNKDEDIVPAIESDYSIPETKEPVYEGSTEEAEEITENPDFTSEEDFNNEEE